MTPAIEVSDLSFRYSGAGPAILDGLNLAVRQGEVFGLLGPSGAGKSTVQRILLGLERGHSGRAQVLGQAAGKGGARFYERVGVSFELPALYLRLTARENLSLFAALYRAKTMPPEKALSMVGLDGEADKPVRAFSKGMKMRLNLARALLHEPELFFLDEPTAGQDPARSRRTQELISSLKAQGRTVFLTTHDMAVAEAVCDRVGFLVGGQALTVDSPDALKRRYGKPFVRVGHRKGDVLDTRDFPLEGLGDDQAFLDLLRGGGVTSIHSQEASLADVFVKVAEGTRR